MVSKLLISGPSGNDLENLITSIVQGGLTRECLFRIIANPASVNLDLIHSIVRHPAMYVGTREFAKVAAFIEGFAFASVDRLNELRDFNRWLTGRLDSHPSITSEVLEQAHLSGTETRAPFRRIWICPIESQPYRLRIEEAESFR